MSSTRRNTGDRDVAETIAIYRPSAKELARVNAFLSDKSSTFARIVPARPAPDAPRVARHRVLPW